MKVLTILLLGISFWLGGCGSEQDAPGAELINVRNPSSGEIGVFTVGEHTWTPRPNGLWGTKKGQGRQPGSEWRTTDADGVKAVMEYMRGVPPTDRDELAIPSDDAKSDGLDDE